MAVRRSLFRRAWSLGMDSLMHGSARATIALTPSLQFERRGFAVHRDLRYSTHEACHLDVYVPRGKGPHPVALYLHGGGFKLGSKRSHEPVARPFLEDGYVVFLVDYRLAPGHPYPAGLEDVAEAFLYVWQHAHRYGGDAARLVVAGESAGANLALSLALMTARRYPWPAGRRVFDSGHAPRVVMPLCGYLETSRPERYATDDLHPVIRDRIVAVSEEYLGDRRSEVGLELASPLIELERDTAFDRPLPPMFVSCGTRDPVLPDSLRLGEALHRRRLDYALRLEPGAIHGYQVMVVSRAARRHWRHALDFARERL